MAELYRICQYDTSRFPFKLILRELLGRDLSSLPAIDEVFSTQEQDQSTSYHARLYRTFFQWNMIYRNFVYSFCPEIVGESFFYQAIPNFRIHLPGNRAVGEFHRDSDYGHPEGEINFWVPVTFADQTSSIWLADQYQECRPIRAHFGDVLIFDGRNTLHGNQINTTKFSRVSFDFRVLPVSKYVRSDAESVNMKLRFEPRSYYSLEPVDV